MKANARQRRFAELYVDGMDATRAYAEAYPGCGHSTANNNGPRLLKHPAVAAIIAELREKIAATVGLTLQEHLDKLAELRDQSVAAERFAPAVTAEISRGKAVGLYVERHEVTLPKGTGVLAVPTVPDVAAWTKATAEYQAQLAQRAGKAKPTE